MVLVDTTNENGLDQLQKDLTEAVQTRKAAQSADTEVSKGDAGSEDSGAAADDTLPEKLRGKSLSEIADMYANLESAYGRMANDLGTQRKLTDQLLALDDKRSNDLQQNTPPEQQEDLRITGTDLLDDPMGTLDKYLERRLASMQTNHEHRLDQIESSMSAERFTAKHGDISAYGQDQQFIGYINASQYRQQLAAKAAQGDYNAADELISEYKSIKDMLASQKTDDTTDTGQEAQDQDANIEAARKASFEGSSSGDAGAGNGKTYKRADLIRLKLERPDLYQDPAFQDEIIRAYAEKRVK